LCRILFGLSGLLLIASCGGEGGDASTSGEDVVVSMFDNRFEFTEIRIPVGGTVKFVGAGRNAHNAVAADGSWSTEDVFGSPEQYEATRRSSSSTSPASRSSSAPSTATSRETAWQAH
jgi:plastocyanin